MFLGFYPGYHGGVLHRRIAQRLAWRKRVALGFLLLLLGALLALFTGERAGLFLPLLALFYPARWEEGRALFYLDRFGLAYRAWLEVEPEDPLYPELARAAREQERRVPLPRLPLWEGALFALLWAGLGAGLFPPGEAWVAGGREAPPALTREAAPEEEGGKAATAPGEAEPEPREQGPAEVREAAPPEGGRAAASEMGPGAEARNEAPPPEGESAAEAADVNGSQGDAPAGRAARPEPGGEPSARGEEPGATAGEPGGAFSKEGTPGTPEAGGTRPHPGARRTGTPGAPGAEPPVPELPPAGPAARLPAPWPQGRPPEQVRRQAERYLGEVPLTPAQRRVLEGYFGLSEPSP